MSCYYIKNINTEEIVVGDDVVYRGMKDDFAGKIVTHRVIKKEKLQLLILFKSLPENSC